MIIMADDTEVTGRRDDMEINIRETKVVRDHESEKKGRKNRAI